jgi:hypothetical protein
VLLTDSVRQAAEVSARDLGVHQLRDVADSMQIWQVGDGEFPPLRVVSSTWTNLPSPTTNLVGRSDDVLKVRTTFEDSRLVTLTAGGGTGKTRVALAVGEVELPERADGVWFVGLTPVSDESLVVPAIAAGLGLRTTADDVTEQVLDYVADRNLLLIVDNCEHVVDEVAEFAERFIACSGVSVMLATSREHLDIEGEQALRLAPLPIDDDLGSPAVELFARRAAAVNSSFELTDDNRDTVAQLCRRLDGMPLAIELAAAWNTVMSPSELLAGIEDRFNLLHGGRAVNVNARSNPPWVGATTCSKPLPHTLNSASETAPRARECGVGISNIFSILRNSTRWPCLLISPHEPNWVQTDPTWSRPTNGLPPRAIGQMQPGCCWVRSPFFVTIPSSASNSPVGVLTASSMTNAI